MQPLLPESWCPADRVTAVLSDYTHRKCPKIDPKGQKVDRLELLLEAVMVRLQFYFPDKAKFTREKVEVAIQFPL